MIEDLVIRPIVEAASRVVAGGDLVTILLVAAGVPAGAALIVALLRTLFARSP